MINYCIGLLGFSIPWFNINILGISVVKISLLLLVFMYSLNFKKFFKLKKNKLTFLIIAYYIVYLVSSMVSSNPLNSFLECLYFFPIVLLIFFIDKSFKITNFMNLFYISMLIRSCIEVFIAIMNIDIWMGKYITFMRFEAAKLGGDPNNIAFLAIIAILFAFFISKNKYYKITSLVIIIHFIMLFSRGAMVALIFSILYYLSTNRKKFRNILRIRYLLVGIVIVVVSLNTFSYIFSNIDMKSSISKLTMTDSSSLSRLTFLTETLNEMDLKEILIGSGAKTYDINFGHWAHNSYLNRFYELGFIGLILYSLIILNTLYKSYKYKSNFGVILTTFVITSIVLDLYLNTMIWIIIIYINNGGVYERGNKFI